MNCKGGLSLTKAPESWDASWDNNVKAAQARRRGRARVPAADRPLARISGLERHPGHDLRDADVGLRAARLDAGDHDLRHAARRLRQSDLCRQADGDRRSHRPRPLRPQHRLRLEPDRVRHDGRRARRSRRPLRLRRGVDRDRQAHLVGARAVRLRRQVLQAEGRARQAEALVGHPADPGERGQFGNRPRVRGATMPIACSPPCRPSTRICSRSSNSSATPRRPASCATSSQAAI